MKPVFKSASKASKRLAERRAAFAVMLAAASLAASTTGSVQAQSSAASTSGKPAPPVVVVLLPADKRMSDQLAQSLVDLKNSLRSNERLQVLTYSPDAPSFIVAARSVGVDLKHLSSDQQRQALANALGANIWVRIGPDKHNNSSLDIAAFDVSSGHEIESGGSAAPAPDGGQVVAAGNAAALIFGDAQHYEGTSAPVGTVPVPMVALPQVAPVLPVIAPVPAVIDVPAAPLRAPIAPSTPLPTAAVAAPAPVTPPEAPASSPISASAPSLPAPVVVPAVPPPAILQSRVIAPPAVAPIVAPPPLVAAPAVPPAAIIAPAPAAPQVVVVPSVSASAPAPAPASVPPPVVAAPAIVAPPVETTEPATPAQAAVPPPMPAAPVVPPPLSNAGTPSMTLPSKQPTPLDSATEALLDEGDAANSQGDTAKAIDDYRQAVDQSPLNASPRVRLAQAYLDSGSADMALSELQRAVAIEPQSAELKTYLEKLQQQHTLAGIDLLVLTVNAASNPSDQQSELALGDAYWNSKNLVLAEQTYRQAAHEAPDPSQADVPYARLARLYAATERYSDCIDALSHSGAVGYPAALRIIQQQSDNLMGSIDSSLQQFRAGNTSRTQLYDQLRLLDAQVSSYAGFLGKVSPPSQYKISYLHRKLAANLMAQMTPNLLNYALTAQTSYLSESQSLQHDALAELSQANVLDHLQDTDNSGQVSDPS